MFALVDCNNFYASCERLFNPKLRGRPVVVLSNNDGCVVARSPEVKALGIPMGIPLFKIREEIRRHSIAVFSSNYELYGDISLRVMKTLRGFSPAVEVYSIDEAFLDLSDLSPEKQDSCGDAIRRRVYQWVGIPVGVGIAPTKTLAKGANWWAKKGGSGLCLLGTKEEIHTLLQKMPIEEVWGIGRRSAAKLSALGVENAADFVRRCSKGDVQKMMGITGVRTWMELQGISCLPLEDAPPPKKSIVTSRSFGTPQKNLTGIEKAVTTFASRCGEKLRTAGQRTSQMTVFFHTSPHKEGKKHFAERTVPIEPPSNDTLTLVRAACEIVKREYRKNTLYVKAGVMVTGLEKGPQQTSIFDAPVQESESRKALMRGVDLLNGKYGKGAVVPARQAGRKGSWEKKEEHRSRRCSTRWGEIFEVG
ncbi:Y-family DNA polymerase [Chitinivibrio alkaliphilus]|uniref:DNA-directed DNA polymerase n=1 Tax=Chitinivibrio alkaliphilus ACht1 TaxID=1313304 RepID=U7D568_9BACT|nr:Y-family DNA polymerase [Chitinivibrio alkaliphilus]ERP30711.1 DNA-directed DNA polymerase [Chitinivibrio alkaliphilus ACht1]